mmetsp:Transcript_61047/g.178512  ORF Transcript_61047/g.178512 Transcript_61047/m.178512 type:complete len:111 (-) Transcript_61047:35-367(-)
MPWRPGTPGTSGVSLEAFPGGVRARMLGAIKGVFKFGAGDVPGAKGTSRTRGLSEASLSVSAAVSLASFVSPLMAERSSFCLAPTAYGCAAEHGEPSREATGTMDWGGWL